MMELFTLAQFELLLKNGSNPDNDHPPVVRLFMSNAESVWLLSELNPDQPDEAFGLCDLGFGFPELGYCNILDIINTQLPKHGIILKSDDPFRVSFPMSAYSAAARDQRRIVVDPFIVSRYYGFFM